MTPSAAAISMPSAEATPSLACDGLRGFVSWGDFQAVLHQRCWYSALKMAPRSSFETLICCLFQDNVGGPPSMPGVMALPRPTRYALRSQAFSPCRSSDPASPHTPRYRREPPPGERAAATARCRASRDLHLLARSLTARSRPRLRSRQRRRRGRVIDHGWRDVTLIQAPAQHAAIPWKPTQRCCPSPPTSSPHLRRSTTCLATYAPVGASRWSGSERWLNPLAGLVGRRYATSFVGFHHPWRLFEHRLADFHLHTRGLGIVYTASGHRS
jgi:hypothetical protein